jgi:hypothetical protein
MLKRNNANQFMALFSLSVVVLMIFLGFLILFSPIFNYFPKKFRTIFAIALFVYGAFRLVMICQKFKKGEE